LGFNPLNILNFEKMANVLSRDPPKEKQPQDEISNKIFSLTFLKPTPCFSAVNVDEIAVL
jgi:hypothetical protein